MKALLKVTRDSYTSKSTIGKLYVNDKFICDTLEDTVREVKIQNKTAIPRGHYKVIINMSTRFKKLMPLLLNVANFTGVRIHSGNTKEDTEGCILVGKKIKDGFVGKSRDTFKLLMKKISDQEVITIEIK